MKMSSVDNNRKKSIQPSLPSFLCSDMSTIIFFPTSLPLISSSFMLYYSTADECLAISDLEVHVRLHRPASEAGVGI